MLQLIAQPVIRLDIFNVRLMASFCKVRRIVWIDPSLTHPTMWTHYVPFPFVDFVLGPFAVRTLECVPVRRLFHRARGLC